MKAFEYQNRVAVLSSETVGTASKFLSLEAFRGLAAVMVVLYHSRFYAGNEYVPFVRHSDIFVDFFFVLSGFVMAHSYLAKISRDMSFRKFILLRFGRLYPLHLFTLCLWVPYIAVKIILYERGIGDTDPSESNNALTFVSNLFLLHAVDGYQPLSWNFPSWTISAEFFTYILFFLFVLAVSRLLSTRKRLAPAVLLTALLAYGLTWVLDAGYGIELFLIQCVGGFFLGVLIYLIYSGMRPILMNVWIATALEVMSCAFLIFSVTKIQGQGFRDNIFFYVSIFSFVCVIFVFVIQENGYISRLMRATVFQFIGKLSYSIYLMHAIILAGVENIVVYLLNVQKTSFEGVSNVIVFPEANFINFGLVIVVIAFSAFTYDYVEVPWRERFKKIASRF